MTALCVVQARMGSTRLPGKVLEPLGDHTVLGLVLARLRRSSQLDVVVATSKRSIDDAVATEAEASGVAVVRGSETDVLERFMVALDQNPSEVVVRITADCPLVDAGVIEEALDLLQISGADYCSNTLLRTFPDGLDVEVMRSDVLREAADEAVDRDEREHVTPFIYRRPSRFRLAQLTDEGRHGRERWTLDTAADLAWLRAAIGQLADPVVAPWREILELVGLSASTSEVLAEPDLEVPIAEGRRAWQIHDGDAALGRAELTLRDGLGFLSFDRPMPHRGVEAVRMALRADVQVRELVVEGAET